MGEVEVREEIEKCSYGFGFGDMDHFAGRDVLIL